MKLALKTFQNILGKLRDVEQELEAIGENMKQLEISAEKAQEREEKLKDKIHTLMERLKVAEARFEYGEMNISKLNLRYTNIHFPDTNHISCGQILCMKNGNAYIGFDIKMMLKSNTTILFQILKTFWVKLGWIGYTVLLPGPKWPTVFKNYRVSHIEMSESEWFWGVEGSIIL